MSAVSSASFVDGVEIVVLHDPHRPLAPASLVTAVVAAVRAGADAAVPVVEVTETVKEVDADGRIVRTVPRDELVQLQYPRAVRRRRRCGRTDRSRPVPERSRWPARRTRSRLRDRLDLELAAAVLAARS